MLQNGRADFESKICDMIPPILNWSPKESGILQVLKYLRCYNKLLKKERFVIFINLIELNIYLVKDIT